MCSFWIALVSLNLFVGFSLQKTDNNGYINLLYNKEGHATILGIFSDRFGSQCNETIERGLEEIASTIWTVETLNKYNYLEGYSIGLYILSVCNEENIQYNITEEVEQFLKSHKNETFLGILTTPEIHKTISASKASWNINIYHIEHFINTDMLTHATVELLTNLHWMKVSRVISDSANTLESFKEKTLQEDIFTYEQALMNDRNLDANFNDSKPDVVVVIAPFADIANITKKLHGPITNLIITPTDFVFNAAMLDLPNHTIVSLPSMGNKAALYKCLKDNSPNICFNHRLYAKGPLFIGTATTILKMLKPVKKVFEERCQKSHEPCVQNLDFITKAQRNKTHFLSQKSMNISPYDVEETLKVLKIETDSNDEMFLYITSVINGNLSEDLAIFQIFNTETKKFQPVLLMIDDDSLGGHQAKNFSFKTKETGIPKKIVPSTVENLVTESDYEISTKKVCVTQNCSNPEIIHSTNDTAENPKVFWRSLTWVTINLSLGFVGVTCTLSTMLYVITRLCKDDVFDGCPHFTLVLMILVIFTFVSSLPFHVELFPDNEAICMYRKNGPPVVFAVLFSLLLSRCIVLAFSESGGDFASHVNGYLQSILCFFILGVQVSFSSQTWISDSDPSCGNGNDKYKILFSLGYDFLLLILLACVSPFIIRSKQNYKEGLLFSISAFFITVVWSAWISFYVLLPDEHKNAAVAFGLNSTASVLLFCVFIPQTYFIAEPFGSGTTLRSLSPLNRNILTEISNSNFKSNQSLNEGGFGTATYRTCEMGLSNPNFLGNHLNENGTHVRETEIDVSREDNY